MGLRIAVIGAGLGGLTLAHALRDRCEVVVFEKGRGPGGRSSTRREGRFAFDHGAQCFTIRTPAFRDWLVPFAAEGCVARWSGPVVNIEGGRVTGPRHWSEVHHVFAPGMNGLARRLASGLDLRAGVDVAPLAAGRGPTELFDTRGVALGVFDLVVSSTTPHQTAALFAARPEAAGIGAGASLKPCHALMVGLPIPSPLDWIAAKVMDGPIKWISVDSSKPGRDASVTTLVAHTRAGWSAPMADAAADTLSAPLLAALQAALPDLDLAQAETVKAHRWRSAIIARTRRPGPFLDLGAGIAATGDWASASRIEEVCMSALALAAEIGQAAG
ncbi:hypothetical protein SAMN02983003_2546 [Devosia enhydra]|uniref:Amine oxidase domain-containing protein n=1 Tax=Devosia enhydra TaxID=665118 RepID=A0A1K2HZ72_9HYPH|nr:NAD(P)-binding protein [Devosia enhydra]SFZ85385.1 hypothetical protein SAMN02983003_2546 [Devosia enhydra]